MAKETAADRLHGKRKPRDPGPAPDDAPANNPEVDPGDRTHAHRRHGGSAAT